MLLFSSDHFDQTISQFSLAMEAAIRISHPQCKLLPHILARFHNLKVRNDHLTMAAYEWCSIICESHSSLENREDLLHALKIGFRHRSLKDDWIQAELTHMESHQKMVDIVFQSGESEAIADLVCAWTSRSGAHEPHPSLKRCAEYFARLSHLPPISPRLLQAMTKTIELIGFQEFEQAGVEGLTGLLDRLHVCIEDMSNNGQWGNLLLLFICSPEGIQGVSHQYWELLVELVVLNPWILEGKTCSPHIMISLEDTEAWDKLESWMGIVWIAWSWGCELDKELETDEKLERITLSLFQQRPGAVQKLEQWVGNLYHPKRQRSKSFQQSFDEVCPNAAQQAAQ